MKICTVNGCPHQDKSRGLCTTHRTRVTKYGSVDAKHKPGKPVIDPTVRFWSHVNKTDDCWLWTASTNNSDPSKAYGIFVAEAARKRPAHIYSYELVNGPVPEGLEVDHICRVRLCVNPTHLRAATRKQNNENRDKNRNGTSGYRGVTWCKRTGKWMARVTHNGKPHFAGYFSDIEDANKAAIALRNELFTHNELDH